MIVRKDKNIPLAVMDAAFSLTMQKNHTITTASLSNGDAAIVQLTTIKLADDKKASSKEIEALQKNNRSQLGALEYELYVNGVRNRAKIKIVSD